MNSVNNTLYQVLSETMEAEDILLACLRINATVKAIGEKIRFNHGSRVKFGVYNSPMRELHV